MSDKEKEYHKKRIAFAIVDNKVLYLENSTMSHKAWLVDQEGLPMYLFELITRGYVLDGKLTFYYGDFKMDGQTVQDGFKYYREICDTCKIPYPTELNFGTVKGEIGEIWKPIKVYKIEEKHKIWVQPDKTLKDSLSDALLLSKNKKYL